jgi:hypothetical protein
MAKYRVYLTTGASVAVDVEVDDSLDPEEARDKAYDEAFQEAPSGVCAHCSGWGQPWGLDLGEWEIEKDHNGKDVEPKLQN